MGTIWESSNKNRYETLKGEIERDIVVVGGGIAGFLTAYRLHEAKQSVTLIEANELFSGVTRRTTAHIEAMQGIKYSEIRKYSEKSASLFFKSQNDAVSEFENLVLKHRIECSFKREDSYLFSTSENTKQLKKEFEALITAGADVEYIENPSIPVAKATAAIKLKNQASFEPIKFLNALPAEFEIFENTKVKDIDFDNKILYTTHGEIVANKIVIATNFSIVNVPGWFFLRMYKSQSYCVALDNAPDIGGMYTHEAANGMTFRNYNDYLIVGGLDHRSGRPDCGADKYDRLIEKGQKIAKGEVVGKWSTNDCVTSDLIPYIGYLSKSSKDVFVITGFNKWGMTNAMVASKLITDMIVGEKNPYQKLFSPQREMRGGLFYLKNTLCTVKNLVFKPLCPPLKCYKSLKNGQGKVVFYKFRKKAVYRDIEGKFHVISPYCAHLGCQVKFNPTDLTWDCPCHGSRFDIDGNIISCPTVEPLDKEKV